MSEFLGIEVWNGHGTDHYSIKWGRKKKNKEEIILLFCGNKNVILGRTSGGKQTALFEAAGTFTETLIWALLETQRHRARVRETGCDLRKCRVQSWVFT
jgi:hypothetical protein